CELHILEREGRGRFWPDKQVWLFDGGSETEARDFIELSGVQLKPIGGIGIRLREIELDGAGEMMRLRLGDEAWSCEGDDQENYRCSGCAGDSNATRHRV